MKKGLFVTTILAAGAAIGAWWLTQTDASSDYGAPEFVDISAGQTLYAESCAACHGASLEGQEDWQSPGPDGKLPAPPHDKQGHTWHHGDGLLFTYTKLGGQETMAQQGMEFESGMPGFGEQFTDAEIWNILGYIKSTWPDRVQEMQAGRSEGERLQREANQ